MIAGTDRGFGASAGLGKLQTMVMWAKLWTMAEGAEIAGKRLWGQGYGNLAVETLLV